MKSVREILQLTAEEQEYKNSYHILWKKRCDVYEFESKICFMCGIYDFFIPNVQNWNKIKIL